MEALLVHRNQTKHHRFSSPPSRNFKGINCRTFQPDAGILPTPFKSCSKAVRKRGSSSSSQSSSPSSSPRTPLSAPEILKPASKSAPIPIKTKPAGYKRSSYEFDDENLSFAELWAGPAYSNSPPPSSLPIPKFSMRPKRTVSLELPRSDSDTKFEMHPSAKSAPSSPSREYSRKRDLLVGLDDATQNLRRILNLELAEG